MKRSLALFVLVLADCTCGKDPTSVANTIAQCVVADGDVRFHPQRDVVWQSVVQGQRFGLGDWVRTAESARAKIRFDSGSIVEMDPTSTVIIETAGDGEDDSLGPLIALESGSFRGSAEKGVSRRISLRTPGGERVSLSPEKSGDSFDYRVSVRGTGEVELAVTSGAALVSSGEARSVLRAGEAKLVSGGRLSETERLLEAPVLGAPVNDSVVTVERGQPAVLAWAEVPGATGYEVEVSSDASFQVAVTRLEVSEPKASLVLGPGTHHWRVSARSKSGLLGSSSAGGQFQVLEKVVLEYLLAPPDGVEIEAARKRTRVEFVWTELSGAAVYELVISRSEDLTKPVLTRSLGDPRVVVTELRPGTYHWGVFAKGAERTPLFRRPFRLRIKKGAMTLQAPNRLDWR